MSDLLIMTYLKITKMKTLLPLIFFIFAQLVLSQEHKVGGMLTIDELNRPGVGGISISVKGTERKTVSDNDGEYRIMVPGNEAILVFSYPGMLMKEVTVGDRKRIDVDLDKIPAEDVKDVFAVSAAIVLDQKACDVVKRVAEVLQKRLRSHSLIDVKITDKKADDVSLNIFIGKKGEAETIDRLSNTHYIKLPGISKPFTEGYTVKTINTGNATALVAFGADNRGVLYAAGEILRQVDPKETGVLFKVMDVQTAPAYRFRGANATQGGTMRKYTKARPWTKEELHEAILDLALAGANTFYAEWGGGERYDFLKSFDLMTTVGIRPNMYYGDMPPEWKAGGLHAWEYHSGNWVCPGISAAREALMKQWEERLGKMADHDVLRFYGGDPGGCRDERCMPWGGTFVKLCEEISEVALKDHPDIKIMIANQDMSSEGDMAIFDYLSEKKNDWLYAMAYGPGSNAMSWYFRKELRDDLFEYPGYGWLNRYLAETLNDIPKYQKIVHYSDITHWTMSQYNVEKPERNIAKSYGRRTWHTRPVALHNIFEAIMPFSQGDIIYTEGYFDQFNQYLWQRLLWNPHKSAEEVTEEYSRLFFGEEAAPYMTKAIFQLEKNLVTPLATNDGIDRYYMLVKEAGRVMPENMMKDNHLWLLFMQKGSLDKYIQLKLQRELFQEERIRKVLNKALEDGKYKDAVAEALEILLEPSETPVMAKYRNEAEKLGDRSEELFGYRNIGIVKIKKPLRNIPGLKKTLEEAKSERKKSRHKELLTEAIEITKKKTDYGQVHW